MSVVGQEPAAPKTKHYFDPESLEDLTACVPVETLQEELEEARRGIISDAYEVFGERLSRKYEGTLRAFAEDPTRHQDIIKLLFAAVGQPTSDEIYGAARISDRIYDIDFTLGAISMRQELLVLEEETEPVTEAEPGFSLTLPALFTNNPAAEYVRAVIENRRLAGSDTALGAA